MSSTYEASDFELSSASSDHLDAKSQLKSKNKLSVFVAGVALLTLFFVTQLLQLLPFLGNIPLAKIAVGFVVPIFIFSPHLIANRLRLREIPQFKYILCILVFAIVTAPVSIWPGGSSDFIIQSYAKNILFVYLLAQGARNAYSTRLIVGALIAGCALIVLSILTGFGPEMSLDAKEERLSVAGTYDVNDLALLFVVTLPFAFFMLKESTKFQRLLLLAAIVLMVVGIIKSASRGGFLGLVIISVFLLIRSSKQVRKYAILAILGGAIMFAMAAPAAYWARISTIFSLKNDYNMNLQTGRVMVWQNGLKMITTYPLTGVGINSFNIAHAGFSGTNINISPHNSFLQIAAELGIPGLLLFLSIIFTSMIAARRVRRLIKEGKIPQELWWLAAAIEISFIGFIVSASLLTHAYSPIFCFLTGISASLVARYRAAEGAQENNQAEIEYA
jgi:O-antigen ligase